MEGEKKGRKGKEWKERRKRGRGSKKENKGERKKKWRERQERLSKAGGTFQKEVHSHANSVDCLLQKTWWFISSPGLHSSNSSSSCSEVST